MLERSYGPFFLWIPVSTSVVYILDGLSAHGTQAIESANANVQSASALNALPHQQVATPKIRINHTYTVFLGLQLILPVGFH